MLFSFLNIDPVTELKLRRRKARAEMRSMRTVNVLAQNRLDRFVKTQSDKEIIADILEECVLAVSNQKVRRVVKPPQCKKVKEEQKIVLRDRKRKHHWRSWLQRGFAIYMFLHPQIFGRNVWEASEALGIARSTLQG